MRAKTRASKRNGDSGRSRTRAARKPVRGAKALRANPFLAVLDTVRRDVDTRLAGLLDSKVDEARQHGPEVEAMVRALRDLTLRGGKRLRAALLVAGYRAASASADLEPALDAGVAIELLHAYLLIHDDWMDEDEVRRGGPAVHTALAKRYRSEKRGSWAAILAGDLGIALAAEALSRVDVPNGRIPRALAAFAQMQADAIAGQQLDVIGRDPDIEKTYTLKTGSYTVAGPLRLGALLAGASPELIAELERFALPAGVAFQLRDDLLSAFGDPKETGKPFGNDILHGKRTVLVERAFELSKGKDRALLSRVVGNLEATPAELRKAVDVLERSGAREAVEKRIEELGARALDIVSSIGLPEARRRLLVGAVEALTERRN
jgi:geranylgeranyl diphosphate synthase type I